MTDYGIDLDEVRHVIETAEVLVVRFSITDRRLLVDARTSDTEGPMIRVVPPAASAEERFKSLKMMRPRFRTPERIMTFQWPRHARSLVESGLWDVIMRKLAALGWPVVGAEGERAIAELIEAERREEIEAIRGGEAYKTIWSTGQLT